MSARRFADIAVIGILRGIRGAGDHQRLALLHGDGSRAVAQAGRAVPGHGTALVGSDPRCRRRYYRCRAGSAEPCRAGSRSTGRHPSVPPRHAGRGCRCPVESCRHCHPASAISISLSRPEVQIRWRRSQTGASAPSGHINGVADRDRLADAGIDPVLGVGALHRNRAADGGDAADQGQRPQIRPIGILRRGASTAITTASSAGAERPEGWFAEAIAEVVMWGWLLWVRPM